MKTLLLKSFPRLSLLKLIMLLLGVTMFGMYWLELPETQQHPTSLLKQELNNNIAAHLSCRPKSHIFFLKMHKCGSSTIQNIIMRRGYLGKLNFILPKRGNYLGHPAKFRKVHADNRFFVKGQSFDILTHHLRYNAKTVNQLMPKDTLKFTVLREPTAVFESLYSYYRLNRSFEYGSSLKMLLDTLEMDMLKKVDPPMERAFRRIGINQMAFDAGLNPKHFKDNLRVDKLIAQMEKQFNLVMIAEHMESSLVLLAEAMCWSLEDVAFIKLNVQPPNISYTHTLSKEDREKLLEMNGADAKIYKHFLRKFQLRVRQYGEERMKEQVRRLKIRNRQLQDECVEREIVPGPPLQDDNRFYANTYEVKANAPEICHLMVTSEWNFTALIRQQQAKRFSKTLLSKQ